MDAFKFTKQTETFQANVQQPKVHGQRVLRPKGYNACGVYGARNNDLGSCLLRDFTTFAIQNKRREMPSSGIVSIHDNDRSHTAGVLDGSSNNFNHPPYIPDLVPSKFHLFPELKTQLGGQRFQTKEVLQDNVNAHLTPLTTTVFEEGIGKLVYRYDKLLSVTISKNNHKCTNVSVVKQFFYTNLSFIYSRWEVEN